MARIHSCFQAMLERSGTEDTATQQIDDTETTTLMGQGYSEGLAATTSKDDVTPQQDAAYRGTGVNMLNYYT